MNFFYMIYFQILFSGTFNTLNILLFTETKESKLEFIYFLSIITFKVDGKLVK